MSHDIANLIGAVTREVKQIDHDGRPARVVIASRTYPTTIDDLWDALTNPIRIPRWFLPISGDLNVGGRYQLKGNAGGTITHCEPPRVFKLTWEFGGQVTWVEVRLAEDPKGGTRLRLDHIAHVGDEMWDQHGPGAVGVGWDLSLHGLGRHLASGAALDPVASMAWVGSAEGKTFVRGTSDDWGRASAAAGTPETDARAAAARTTTAYGGDADPPPNA